MDTYKNGDRLRVGEVEGVWREYADVTDTRFITGGALLYETGNGVDRALLIPVGVPVERLSDDATPNYADQSRWSRFDRSSPTP